MLTSDISNIPQNENNFFIFRKGLWNYSIDIILNKDYYINTLNLYAILKSYTIEESYLIKDIMSIWILKENDKFIEKHRSESFSKIKKIDFLDFEIFFMELIDRDYEYNKKTAFSGFKIIFYKESVQWQNGTIYPKYPWNSYIDNNFIQKNYKYFKIGDSPEYSVLKKENIELKNKIKELTYSLNILKNKK